MEKLPGVESAQLSLNEGRAVIRLHRGNAVTMAQIHRIVERNGFTPRQAVVAGEAEVAGGAGELELRISGTADTYRLAGAPRDDGVLRQLQRSAGRRVIINGLVGAQKDRRTTPVMQVTSVEPAPR
jgi:hypothetical protein